MIIKLIIVLFNTYLEVVMQTRERVLKFFSSVIVFFCFLVIPLYYPFQTHSTFAVLGILAHTVILPETAIPLWLHVMGLDRVDTFILVAFVSRLPIIALFWPKLLYYIIPERLKNLIWNYIKNVAVWSKKILSQLDRFIKNWLGSKREKNPGFNFWLFLASGVVLIFLLVFNFFKRVKNWFKKKNKRIKTAIVDLGYLGVIIGAGTPFVPGTREAGMVAAVVIGNNMAKILYNVVDVIRILVETILF